MSTFAAIDFETATKSEKSACAVGVVVVHKKRITARKSLLIQPPGNQYDQENISIHGITPERTKDAGRFDEVWPEIAALIGDRLVVAHYAKFDLAVLRDSARAADYVPPYLHFSCSYWIARRAWPNLNSYKLKDLAAGLGIKLNHHDALSDANAAAMIVLAAQKRTRYSDVYSMISDLGLRIDELKQGRIEYQERE